METLHSAKYREFVLDDLEKSAGLSHPCRAGFLERLLVHHTFTKKLHPNPDDEFCDPKVGPNYGIVRRYISAMSHSGASNVSREPEPLFVEKMVPNGYRILNGHHRYLAACIQKKKTLPIRIVNVTHVDDIRHVLEHATHPVCISFDLDEVLLCTNGQTKPESRLLYPRSLLFRGRIREGASALIRELRRSGCEIWVYTSGYTSDRMIRLLLGAYRIKVEGVVNGMKKKRSSRLAEDFKRTYRLSLHIDSTDVLCVDTADGGFEQVDLKRGDALWASEAASAAKSLIEAWEGKQS